MNLSEFKSLIKRAQGNRSQNQFALNSGINSAAITKYLNGTLKPKADTLIKIANHAHNGVTFEQLMTAAGYLPEGKINQNINTDIYLSAKMQQATELLKQIDENNLNTVIGFLEGALRIQEQTKQTNKN